MSTNALFRSYYQILPSLGIDADHDSRYARVLFKIGGMQGRETLYTKFEAVLARMGIEIQIEVEGGSQPYGDETGYATNSQAQFENSSAIHRSSPPPRPHARPRRNSGSTLSNIVATPEDRIPRSRSQSSYFLPKHAQPHRLAFAEHGVQTRPELEYTPEPAVPILETDHPIGAWLSRTVPVAEPPPFINISTSYTSAHRHHQQPNQRHRAGRPATQLSQYDSDGFLIGGPTSVSSDLYDPPSSERQYDDEFEEEGFTYDSEEFEEAEEFEVAPAEEHVPESTTNLEMRAVIFRTQRRALYVAGILPRWHDIVQTLRMKNRDMCVMAENFDSQLVCKLAIDLWQAQLEDKRKEQEHERIVVDVLSKRNRYTLERCLSTWRRKTKIEQERVENAWQRLLVKRMFKPWHEITINYNAQIRKFGLTKYFELWQKKLREQAVIRQFEQRIQQNRLKTSLGKWRQKLNVYAVREQETTRRYTENLVKTNYWAWYMEYCNRNAPRYYDAKLLPRILDHWIETHRRHVAQESTATLHRKTVMLSNPLRKWRQKCEILAKHDHIASAKYTKSAQMNSLVKWSFESHLLPARFQVQNMVAARIKRTSLLKWNMRAQQVLQATALDRRKLMREGWTRWTDMIRVHHFQVFINQRIIDQAIYRWTVAERIILVQRNKDKDLKRLCFNEIHSHAASRLEIAGRDTAIATNHSDLKVKSRALAHLRAVLSTRQEHEAQVLQVYATRIAHQALTQWTASNKHMLELNRWARDGNYYFLAKRTLKKWRAVAQESRKDRRRRAFAQFRRQVKIKTATSILHLWRDKAKLEAASSDLLRQNTAKIAKKTMSSWRNAVHTIKASHELADATLSAKTITLATTAFTQWRQQQQSISSLESLYHQSTLTRHLHKWHARTLALHDLETESTSLNIDRLTLSALKKWRTSTLQLQGIQTGRLFIATNHYETVQKRAARRILVYWHDRTPARALGASTATSTTITTHTSNPDKLSSPPSLSSTARAETWSEYDEPGFSVEEWAREFSTTTTNPTSNPAINLTQSISSIPHHLAQSTSALPGYLATPSRKRRPMPGKGLATTTPAQKLSTPFEKLLRAKYGGGAGGVAGFRRA